MESFLFIRINQISRQKDPTSIGTLGPYSVALTKVINCIEALRSDKIKGKFVCYRGLVLAPAVIKKWASQKEIQLDGYSSTSFDELIARKFA